MPSIRQRPSEAVRRTARSWRAAACPDMNSAYIVVKLQKFMVMYYTSPSFVLHGEFHLMKSAASSGKRHQARLATSRSTRLREVMAIAEEEGLLAGERTRVVRGRMPRALVTRAKNRTAIASDTELIEVALANIAVADDYTDWLLSQRGAVPAGVDLEF